MYLIFYTTELKPLAYLKTAHYLITLSINSSNFVVQGEVYFEYRNSSLDHLLIKVIDILRSKKKFNLWIYIYIYIQVNQCINKFRRFIGSKKYLLKGLFIYQAI
jgi:hypothetical protein